MATSISIPSGAAVGDGVEVGVGKCSPSYRAKSHHKFISCDCTRHAKYLGRGGAKDVGLDGGLEDGQLVAVGWRWCPGRGR